MLKGENIILRPLKLSDWEKTLKWRNNLIIKEMAMMHPFPITEFIEKEWYENILRSKDDCTIYFTVTNLNDNPFGFFILKDINQIHRNCSLSIVIGETEYQGKGYGLEIMKIIMSYAFNALNMNKITLEVFENNIIALKLYLKLGFIEEGRLKQQYFTGGKYLDVIVLSAFSNPLS